MTEFATTEPRSLPLLRRRCARGKRECAKSKADPRRMSRTRVSRGDHVDPERRRGGSPCRTAPMRRSGCADPLALVVVLQLGSLAVVASPGFVDAVEAGARVARLRDDAAGP